MRRQWQSKAQMQFGAALMVKADLHAGHIASHTAAIARMLRGQLNRSSGARSSWVNEDI